MISKTQHTTPGDASALDAASNNGADPIVLIPDLDRPGLPQCGEPAGPTSGACHGATRSHAAGCVGATHWLKKPSPTVERRREVSTTRGRRGPDKNPRPGPGRPGLGGTDRVAECGAFTRIDHRPGRLVHMAHGREVREMTKRNTRQTSAKAASAASKVLSNPKASKAAKSAAASALSQTPKRK